jgi:hypothetical protein
MRLKTNFKADIRFVEKSGHYTKNGVSIYLEDCTRLPNILKKLANIINDYLEDFDENRGALDRDISNKKLFKSLGLEQEEEEENES